MPGTKRSRSSSSETLGTGSSVNELQERRPVASTSAQLPRERVITFMDEEEEKPWVEHTTVNRDCSSSTNMTHSSADRPEMSRVASVPTEVQIQREIIANDGIEEVVVSDSNSMDRNYSSSLSGQQSLPSVRRSKRVSTMVSKEMEKYYEGCLVMLMDAGLPFGPGMIRTPDDDMLNHTNVDSGDDEYTCKQNGVIYLYVQMFEEPVTLKKVKTGNLQLFDADFRPQTGYWLKTVDQTPTVIANYNKGMKIANAASKYSVEERIRKFTLRVGTSIGNLLTEIENENSQPTTNATIQQLPILPNESTAQGTHGNGRKCPDSVELMKKQISEYQKKLREECYRERDEEIKRLTAGNTKLAEEGNKLKVIVRKQVAVIAELHKKCENENQEKLKYKEELEKVKAMFEEMFGASGAQSN